MKTIIKELYQEYPRFNVYKVYRITKNSDGKIINKEFLWNTTEDKRISLPRRTIQEQIEIVRIKE